MLIECEKCKGKGYLIKPFKKVCCPECKGKGFVKL